MVFNRRNFLTDILEYVKDENDDDYDDRLQGYLESRDISQLPADEELWEVAKPANWPPPPEPPTPPVYRERSRKHKSTSLLNIFGEARFKYPLFSAQDMSFQALSA